mgnify:CR=1 FL=1
MNFKIRNPISLFSVTLYCPQEFHCLVQNWQAGQLAGLDRRQHPALRSRLP